MIHHLIYLPVKYKDDGRDIVSFIDFITIHCTFPAINAWVSYQAYYCLAVTFTSVCTTNYIAQDEGSYCYDYQHTSKFFWWGRFTYFYSALVGPSIIAFCLLFVEASINLTYYKDCIFSATSLLIFFGMLWVQFKYKWHIFNENQAIYDPTSTDFQTDA